MKELIGIPDWIVGLLVLAVWTAATAVWHAVELRRTITPRFSLSFDPRGSGIGAALDRAWTLGPGGWTQIGSPFSAHYVRIQIDVLSKIRIDDCVVGIKSLQKKPDGTHTFVPVNLPQIVYLREDPIKIYPNMPRTIDFLRTNEKDNKLLLPIDIRWPSILETVFDDMGAYRFEFVVNGGGVSISKWIEIVWNGHWNAITGREVSP